MASPSATGPWRHGGLGLEIAAVVAALTAAGWWLDTKWGTGPWYMLGGAVLGIVGSLYNLIKEVFKQTK